ncbi:ArfGap-domain-containing protein [Rhizoclosmatium globosum]|uniref:ArfGap-domain-containing protein n=1 Tax=Rhizoclosmatium globosum TaxID=329046 RepID=A0A1Y2BQ31_9FUNG|nr:ArfGap-domain-containing protein [Rhizoclosmatium globosum]|eukprot:ORY36861.1 ArfGap-domain-containing protein [Rhizoclosmatium globosum]
MSTRHERMNNKSLNEQHSKILKELMQRADNRRCVDCRKKDPRWASWNLGVFMCIRCSGVHRSIGTHITKVKSADLDAWTPEQIASMVKWGNAKANAYWEGGLAPGFEGPPEANIDQWIREKYDGKRFAARGPIPDPDTIPLPAGIAPVSSGQPAGCSTATSRPVATFAQFPASQQTQQVPQQQQQQQQPAKNASQDLFDIFQGPSTSSVPNSFSGSTLPSTGAAAPSTLDFKSNIMSLYSTPQSQQAQPQQQTQQPQQSFQFPQQSTQQQQQPQLAGFQFFSTATPQPQPQFANFASFPSSSIAPGLSTPLQPALGSALLPGAAPKPAVGGIPDFMGLGGGVSQNQNLNQRGSFQSGQSNNDKDMWGEFQ